MMLFKSISSTKKQSNKKLNKRYSFKKSLSTALLCGVFLGTSINQVYADDFSDAFNYLMSSGNPAIYNTEVRGFATGGSFDLIIPQRSVTIISLTAPSIDVGCGGISAFLGGFSYINLDVFINLLKNIATSALGYAFILTLGVLCPICKSVMEGLQKAVQMATSLALNSCNFGVGLVNEAINSSDSLKKYVNSAGAAADSNSGQDNGFLSSMNNIAGDFSKGMDKFNNWVNKISNTKLQTQERNKIGQGAHMWNALPELDDAQKSLLLSLTGDTNTYIQSGTQPIIVEIMPTLSADELANLLVYGADSNNNQNVHLLGCTQYDNTAKDFCTKVEEVPVKNSFWAKSSQGKTFGGIDLFQYGYYGAVYALLMQAIYAAESNEDLGYSSGFNLQLPAQYGAATLHPSFSKAQILGFLNSSPLPLYQAVNIAGWSLSGGADVAKQMISNVALLVAKQFAYSFIEHDVLDLTNATQTGLKQGENTGSSGVNKKLYADLKKSLDSIRMQITQNVTAISSDFEFQQGWIGQLHQVQSELYSQAVQSGIAGNMAFTNKLSVQ
ncbi:MAG: conjugal transfer protein TraH [Proteobacteria bacterium]|nr:conjugal transfer protein TraH [Pseudomonadota bacterium]